MLLSCIAGQDEQDEQSSSFVNMAEADHIANLAAELIDQKVVNGPGDICIISPYRAQIREIRARARASGLGCVLGASHSARRVRSSYCLTPHAVSQR